MFKDIVLGLLGGIFAVCAILIVIEIVSGIYSG